MKKWQSIVLEELYSLLNKIGNIGDLTAVNMKRMIACTQANQRASMVLSATFFENDPDKASKYLRELRLLSRWNFPDRYGNLTDEEKQINERLRQHAVKHQIEIFFSINEV